MSRRLGWLQSSFVFRPSHGRAPRQVPSGFSSMQRRLVEAARLAALAAHDEIGEVAARAALVEPELPPAVVLGAVDEAAPVEVVDVSLRAGAHEAGGHDLPAVEAALVVERLAMDQPAGALALLARRSPPARRTTPESARRRCPRGVSRGSFESGGGAKSRGAATPVMSWSLRVSRGSTISSRSLVFGQVSRPPTIAECLRQVDQRAGPVGGDDLAAADLPVRLAAHARSSTCDAAQVLQEQVHLGLHVAERAVGAELPVVLGLEVRVEHLAQQRLGAASARTSGTACATPAAR